MPSPKTPRNFTEAEVTGPVPFVPGAVQEERVRTCRASTLWFLVPDDQRIDMPAWTSAILRWHDRLGVHVIVVPCSTRETWRRRRAGT